MFRGVTQLSLDNKGRLAIPARYRDELLDSCAGNIVITADPSRCLLIYPQPEWEPIKKAERFFQFQSPDSPSAETHHR